MAENRLGRCRLCRGPVFWCDVEVIDEVYMEGFVHLRLLGERGAVPLHWLDEACAKTELKLKDARWRG